MSRARGILPLFLATAFGIANGVWVFGPALKEQQEAKDGLAKKNQEVAEKFVDGNLDTLRRVEAEASRTLATESALKPVHPTSSWWPKGAFWSSGERNEKQAPTKDLPSKQLEKEAANQKT